MISPTLPTPHFARSSSGQVRQRFARLRTGRLAPCFLFALPKIAGIAARRLMVSLAFGVVCAPPSSVQKRSLNVRERTMTLPTILIAAGLYLLAVRALLNLFRFSGEDDVQAR